MACASSHLNLWFKGNNRDGMSGGCPFIIPATMDKPDQRRRLRQQRRRLSDAQRSACAHALAAELAGHRLFLNSRKIAAYLPVDGEVETSPLIRLAWDMGKEVYLPVLAPAQANRLWFSRFDPDTTLVGNRFGIPEPERAHRQRIAVTALDLVLAPLVGFDTQGHRLGMGGGFYDRTFAFLRHRRHWKKPRLVGLAYEFQRLEALPGEPWDVPLSGVATEAALYLFDPG